MFGECDCIDGFAEDGDGNCVGIPCPRDPLADMQILGTLNNGIPRGQYGNARVYNHDGIDLKAFFRTPIFAAKTRVVANTPFQDNWIYGDNNAGNRLYINTDLGLENNFQLGYWHLNEVIVDRNEIVTKGQLIGYTGVSGNVLSKFSAGLHLHVRARLKGQKANPEDFFGANFNEDGDNTNNCN
ncbi:murein endopeptidase activator, peptidase M23 family NlpD-like protein [Psychroflexus torquis ATCC 700755]|uniref:Murein endopeptidase activator, peptidase M23 family NlpD-like protein n=1 Tax=Psychroflexus torquis (strain ATCC 700755 / CIP 106069 / ACAM 623) TaxID=313595 RepID=K4IFA2_PSYTT|nr:M23 family metallopeptidase [Psychroflexus torquis]AFU69064.1 murein endopeptidase activator, peptidase M23 family NlpD-like protein [Psychroflexus torquis ATCC 700755]